MTQQQRNQGFWRNTLDLIEQVTNLKFSTDVQKTMDHNFVWDRRSDPRDSLWREAEADRFGRTRVTRGIAQLNIFTPRSVAVNTATETLVADVNLTRQYLYVDNLSPNGYFFGLKQGDATSGSGLTAPNDQILILDSWQGQFWAFTNGPSVTLNVYEL